MSSLIASKKGKKKNRAHNINVPDMKSLKSSLQENLQELKQNIGESSDVIFRYFLGQSQESPAVAIIYIDGLVNSEQVDQDILQPFSKNADFAKEGMSNEDILKLIQKQIVHVGSVSTCETFEDIHSTLFEGHTIVLIEGSDTALSLDTVGWEKRTITEPSSQGVIRGPKEGFTEDLRTSTSLLRRRIKSAELRIEQFKIGQRTHTGVAMVYLKGIASEQVIDEVRSRLNAINTDSILESSYIEEFIQDGGLTPFPTMQNTERPDAVAGGILEGQIGILIDGTPFALLAPSTFFSFFQSSEDYYQRYDISSFLRLIRYGAFFVSMLLPALYIAITTFHQEMIPTTLVISLAAQREGVPFPAIIEAFMMELTFDVLREAGVRMPRAIGPAISIVGALVLGQAAVQAGLVSAAMVIVVSFTAICNFVIPALAIANAIRLIRFLMMLAAGVLGLFGIMSLLIVLLIHMASLRSFGVPYLSPVAPMTPRYLKDVFIRAPIWSMKTRPKIGPNKETQRQAPNNKKAGMQAGGNAQSQQQNSANGSSQNQQQSSGSSGSSGSSDQKQPQNDGMAYDQTPKPKQNSQKDNAQSQQQQGNQGNTTQDQQQQSDQSDGAQDQQQQSGQSDGAQDQQQQSGQSDGAQDQQLGGQSGKDANAGPQDSQSNNAEAEQQNNAGAQAVQQNSESTQAGQQSASQQAGQQASQQVGQQTSQQASQQTNQQASQSQTGQGGNTT